MCMSTPSVPPPPPPPQEIKQPDNAAKPADMMRQRRNSAAMGAGSLLTGPTGIAASALNTGKSTLLGG
jgi:hypothetical protein